MVPVGIDSLSDAYPGGATVLTVQIPAGDFIVDGFLSLNAPDAYQHVERPRRGDRLRGGQAVALKFWLTRPVRVMGTLMLWVADAHQEMHCIRCSRTYYTRDPGDLSHECSS